MPSKVSAGPVTSTVSGLVVTVPARQFSASVPMNSPRTGISLVSCRATVTVTRRSSQSEMETLSDPTLLGKSYRQLKVCSPSVVMVDTSSSKVMLLRFKFINVFFRPEMRRSTLSSLSWITIRPRSVNSSCPTMVMGMSRTVVGLVGFSTLMT